MQDALISQIDKPQPHITQEPTQPTNFTSIPQFDSIKAVSQPYLFQSVNQPYVINTSVQPNVVAQTNTQPFVIQTAVQSLVFQPLKIDADSKKLKKKLFYIRIWVIIMFVPTLIDIYDNFYNEAVPECLIFDIIVLDIVNYLIYRSVKNCEAKKYNIALHLYVVFFIVACCFYSYSIFYLSKSSSRYRNVAPIY